MQHADSLNKEVKRMPLHVVTRAIKRRRRRSGGREEGNTTMRKLVENVGRGQTTWKKRDAADFLGDPSPIVWRFWRLKAEAARRRRHD